MHSTGHDLTGLSALWEYLSARVALVMAGALVLVRSTPYPYHLPDHLQHPHARA